MVSEDSTAETPEVVTTGTNAIALQRVSERQLGKPEKATEEQEQTHQEFLSWMLSTNRI